VDMARLRGTAKKGGKMNNDNDGDSLLDRAAANAEENRVMSGVTVVMMSGRMMCIMSSRSSCFYVRFLS
jgi:hypothetical protein